MVILKQKVLLLAMIMVIFVSSVGVAKAGFGISPPYIINKNLVPGSFLEQDIFLVQSQPDQALNVSATVDAPEIAGWIKIENGNNFQIPAGVQQFPVKIDIAVPSNSQLKEYTGKITLSTSPAGEKKSGVSVVLGAEVKIDLTVTSIKVSNFSIQNFQIPDAREGSPIEFVIKVKNDGNVDNGPTKVALTFFDQYHSAQLGQVEKDITEKVGPFQTKDISVDFPNNNFKSGSYWADVKVYSGDKIVVDSKLVFNVGTPQVNQAKSASKNLLTIPNLAKVPMQFYLIAAVAIIIILVIAIIIVLVKLKRQRNKIKINKEDGNKK